MLFGLTSSLEIVMPAQNEGMEDKCQGANEVTLRKLKPVQYQTDLYAFSHFSNSKFI